MQDFNDYVNNTEDLGEMPEGMDPNVFNMVSSLAQKFDGKSQNELLMAIYNEAKRGKQNGTLTNSDIDNFAAMLSPMLDDKKRKLLLKVVSELKKI